ncbi:hypothetical protein [Salinicola sp. CPA57]|uniref:hypothetical protein n=1 Tax=Salinicola sp. CPA57 TaxID=1949080 RepID=UPI000DA17C7E|nr:hypothetical protein [Salinicola sp. CPA57]
MSKSIEHAEAALASAKADLLNELERDAKREDGSDAQEQRRERHQQSLRDKVAQCERDLEESKHNAG